MQTNKKIKLLRPLTLRANPMGFTSVDLFHHDAGFEPFLVFTEFHMDRAIFGPHPHAGVSVVTYMLPDSKGSFLNRDSQGDHSIIEPGGLHVTQAGRGMHHDEVPAQSGVDCHGFQIWINHSESNRMVEPKAFHAMSGDVPEVKLKEGKVRVLLGSFEDKASPIQLVTPVSLLDVYLQPGAQLKLDAQEMALIYLISGQIHLQDQEVGARALVTFVDEAKSITLSAGAQPVQLLYATGTPHREPIVHGGPFVMTTEEQMRITRQRLMKGEMGSLSAL
jgi:quercetin 2,3-dioxygenase